MTVDNTGDAIIDDGIPIESDIESAIHVARDLDSMLSHLQAFFKSTYEPEGEYYTMVKSMAMDGLGRAISILRDLHDRDLAPALSKSKAIALPPANDKK